MLFWRGNDVVRALFVCRGALFAIRSGCFRVRTSLATSTLTVNRTSYFLWFRATPVRWCLGWAFSSGDKPSWRAAVECLAQSQGRVVADYVIRLGHTATSGYGNYKKLHCCPGVQELSVRHRLDIHRAQGAGSMSNRCRAEGLCNLRSHHFCVTFYYVHLKIRHSFIDYMRNFIGKKWNFIS